MEEQGRGGFIANSTRFDVDYHSSSTLRGFFICEVSYCVAL
ncbi:rCG57473 [Rattus norvegicus]|uniref:RCG57473 n=1 Tax=Rattus norvegicus TaxID=10116 RepID=A6JHG6_RAT|nr:rCG57473 [Rattus norvegicus]